MDIRWMGDLLVIYLLLLLQSYIEKKKKKPNTFFFLFFLFNVGFFLRVLQYLYLRDLTYGIP